MRHLPKEQACQQRHTDLRMGHDIRQCIRRQTEPGIDHLQRVPGEHRDTIHDQQHQFNHHVEVYDMQNGGNEHPMGRKLRCATRR